MISIEAGLCQCGCGGKTKLAPYSNKTTGWVRGEPIRFIVGHNQRGRLLPREAVESKYVVNATTGCWEWARTRNPRGYGHVWDPARRMWTKAYRYVYEVHRGQIPEGLELDHLCRNTSCVNPGHLEPA